MSQSTSTIISPAVAIPERAYTIPEVAAALRITTTAVYRHVQEWPHMLIGGEIRFTEAQYQSILAMVTKVPTRPSRAPYGSRAGRQS